MFKIPGLKTLLEKKISWIFAFLRNRCELIHSTNKNHVYIVHLYILLVCLYLINVKTIEPIESKFFVWQPAWPVKRFLKTVKNWTFSPEKNFKFIYWKCFNFIRNMHEHLRIIATFIAMIKTKIDDITWKKTTEHFESFLLLSPPLIHGSPIPSQPSTPHLFMHSSSPPSFSNFPLDHCICRSCRV